jgi:hypothetical protein
MRLAPQDAVDTGRLKAVSAFTAVDPVAALHRAPDDAVAFAAKLAPGTRLSVRVEAELPDGGSRGRTRDGGHEVKLPFAARPGDVLELVLVSNATEPTFSRATSGTPGAAQLSRAALALADLAPLASAGAQAASEPAPLLDGAPSDSTSFAAALEQALAGSGLFYESHQAQWLAGMRSREALVREPQGRLAAAFDSGTPRTDTGRADLAQVIHRDALPLVQRQLAALESGVVVWRGAAWPGQPMAWDVARDRERPASDDGATPWRTRVELALPRLGALAAALAIDGDCVSVRVTAARAPVADMLRFAAPRLASRLLAAGLAVASIEVRHAAG